MIRQDLQGLDIWYIIVSCSGVGLGRLDFFQHYTALTSTEAASHSIPHITG